MSTSTCRSSTGTLKLLAWAWSRVARNARNTATTNTSAIDHFPMRSTTSTSRLRTASPAA